MNSKSSDTYHSIHDAVRRMYEAFPYPKYPLFGRLRWQDGYLASSKFAAQLLEENCGVEAAINTTRGQYVRDGRNVLVAGAGEALPYIMRKFEPSTHRLLCVDISSANINRARWRLKADFKPTQFIRSDINRFLAEQAAVTGPYNHIDVYGVLHHLAEPGVTLKYLSSHLSENGTMRMMVYNSKARHWIHQLQSVFRLLKLDRYNKNDRRCARELLLKIAAASPYLNHKIKSLGPKTINNDARLVDTFFHVREAKINIRKWFQLIDEAGLKAYALYDRYQELDDLKNPLWEVPKPEDLESRAKKGLFENNLELYLCKKEPVRFARKNYGFEKQPSTTNGLSYMCKQPPSRWFNSEELASTGWLPKIKLWWAFLSYISKDKSFHLDRYRKYFSLNAFQRLAREGAVFKGQFKNSHLQEIMRDPISSDAAKPETFDKTNFSNSSLSSTIDKILREKSIYSERRHHLILERLNRSQFNLER